METTNVEIKCTNCGSPALLCKCLRKRDHGPGFFMSGLPADVYTERYIRVEAGFYCGCTHCHTRNGVHDTPEAAIEAFINPPFANTYDPATEVKVSRETAIILAQNVRGLSDAESAAVELRAAMEVGK